MNTKNTIRINDDSVDLSVSVFLFREDETYIAYCPSLDISGYDKTEEGAKADLEYMLKSWAKEQLTNGTIREDLEVNNWKASIRNAWVAGSSPAGGSKGFRNLHINELRKS